jgi:hypothetical protein
MLYFGLRKKRQIEILSSVVQENLTLSFCVILIFTRQKNTMYFILNFFRECNIAHVMIFFLFCFEMFVFEFCKLQKRIKKGLPCARAPFGVFAEQVPTYMSHFYI